MSEISEYNEINMNNNNENNIAKTTNNISNLVNKHEVKNKFQTNIQALLDSQDIISAIRNINSSNNVNSEKLWLKNKANNNNNKSNNDNVKRVFDAKNEEKLDIDDEDLYNEYFKLDSQPENLTGGELKDYQLDGLNWLLKLHFLNINGILADEMGLGKTIQTISLVAYLELIKKGKNKYIVIVPKVTLNNWAKEFTKWLPSIRLLIFYGDKDERKRLVDVDLKQGDFEVILTTYECAMKEKNSLAKINFEYIIVDEAHRIKNKDSKLSADLRCLKAKHKLLITGTPLQNNLTELWSLLNFLMPKIFDSHEDFDEIFNLEETTDHSDQLKLVSQIHLILKPFVLRRLKTEVQVKLPGKKEIYLYMGLSNLQKSLYKQILTKNIDTVNSFSKDKIQLLNVLMQLKKVCNHPYLFPKVEEGPPYVTGEHLVENSMKLFILDRLLSLKLSQNSKILIFSQMVTVLNILDDYCRYRNYRFCRIDGSTSRDDRDRQIEEFQSPYNKDINIFLLSTRSGGLGINLHAANTVVIFDSDWNPQVDLQAIDRAHRIGQTKEVTVYRFVTEGTVEEKIVERAAKKLKIDHLIIQKGKNILNKPSALELNSMIHHGAADLFNSENNNNNIDIFDMIKYSENKTENFNGKLKSLEDKMNITNLSLVSTSNDIYQFEGEDYKKYTALENNFINVSNFGSRERKFIYQNFVNSTNGEILKRKPRVLTGWRAKANGGYDHQLFKKNKLDELDDKERKWNDYLSQLEKLSEEINENNDEDKGDNNKESNKDSTLLTKQERESQLKDLIDNEPEEFTAQDEEKREYLLSQGFSKWSKKDFQRLCEALKTISSNNYTELSNSIKGKSQDEIKNYLSELLKNLDSIKGGYKIKQRISDVNAINNKIDNYHSKIKEYIEYLTEKTNINNNIYSNIEFKSGNKKKKGLSDNSNINDNDLVLKESDSNNEGENSIDIIPKYSSLLLDDDKYLICMLLKFGYGNWSRMKFHILFDPKIRFNLGIKTLSESELKERCISLLNKVNFLNKKEEELIIQQLKAQQEKEKQQALLLKKQQTTVNSRRADKKKVGKEVNIESLKDSNKRSNNKRNVRIEKKEEPEIIITNNKSRNGKKSNKQLLSDKNKTLEVVSTNKSKTKGKNNSMKENNNKKEIPNKKANTTVLLNKKRRKN